MAESEDIFDGHNDSLLRLLDIESPVEAFRDGNDQTHIDMPRLKKTDFKAGMFAIFVPNENGEYERIETEHGYEYELSDPITIERAQRMTGQMLVLLNQLTTNIDSLV
ncbi:MAG: membrane dipeptidase, partial [Halobacteriaceae archaeon]